ncbi:NAD-dependent epimerase/dehydratase family protein [Riemerella anatipestifer]|uniref:NAD-dependent epimerase/dehydratase family protein n=2 Tax=Riemerella anatipestifer TaxID=34085 RepID=A0AAP3EW85_RIEAN|nr:NAD-dependent epimerase/dehydratase family protein [Riemerella anatipestifer]AZZ58435.1 NAD-dependent epimerase [Riemerella anatipestifer]MBT0572866.1 NAD-dependent epimerase/dehydratase family protein [Riemerella anatipestifer]MCO4304500.1 NAD-dependent epimerase/dehydratase family protein [Riemerella anatipestifer]MCO7319007.1 NAD-dependent epimerase/dehydratase family protein [Riemerella anatipestifer]MCO7353273.1 NAD-dependent epimerase/dehydratase family protein [Riemerella anatipestif
MIVGKGLVASLFTNVDREDIIFFASGVSNSLEVRMEEFMREENLVRETIANHPDKIMVYFSTCSIYDSSKVDSPYVRHKLKMENIVSNNCSRYLILRLSNVVGKGGNPNLLMNYLVRSVMNGEVINVHTKATRNLIDADDVRAIVLSLIETQNINKIINLAYLENYTIVEILEILESFFKIRLNLNLVKAGASYPISTSSEVENYYIQNKLLDKENYLRTILSKYYSICDVD